MEQEHVHGWRHLGGAAFGMYRCDLNPDARFAIGYSKVYRGASYKQKIIPYKCGVCGGWSVVNDRIPLKANRYRFRQEWRCKNHRISTPTNQQNTKER